MRVLGVSIDEKNPPKREELIALAMVTKRFKDNPLAEKEIAAELAKSPLYQKADNHGLPTGVAAEAKPAKPAEKS